MTGTVTGSHYPPHHLGWSAFSAINYEQDWLDDEYNKMSIMHENVTFARQWLMQVGGGAG